MEYLIDSTEDTYASFPYVKLGTKMKEDKTRTRRYSKDKITYDMSPLPQEISG